MSRRLCLLRPRVEEHSKICRARQAERGRMDSEVFNPKTEESEYVHMARDIGFQFDDTSLLATKEYVDRSETGSSQEVDLKSSIESVNKIRAALSCVETMDLLDKYLNQAAKEAMANKFNLIKYI